MGTDSEINIENETNNELEIDINSNEINVDIIATTLLSKIRKLFESKFYDIYEKLLNNIGRDYDISVEELKTKYPLKITLHQRKVRDPAMICIGTKKSGEPCCFTKKPGHNYCGVHLKLEYQNRDNPYSERVKLKKDDDDDEFENPSTTEKERYIPKDEITLKKRKDPIKDPSKDPTKDINNGRYILKEEVKNDRYTPKDEKNNRYILKEETPNNKKVETAKKNIEETPKNNTDEKKANNTEEKKAKKKEENVANKKEENAVNNTEEMVVNKKEENVANKKEEDVANKEEGKGEEDMDEDMMTNKTERSELDDDNMSDGSSEGSVDVMKEEIDGVEYIVHNDTIYFQPDDMNLEELGLSDLRVAGVKNDDGTIKWINIVSSKKKKNKEVKK